MQSATNLPFKRNIHSAHLKRVAFVGLLAVTTFMGALSVPTQPADAGRVVRGALLGAGVGAIFGGGRGAVAGAITGGVLGGLSKKRRRRRW
jgi:hypothetical protein